MITTEEVALIVNYVEASQKAQDAKASRSSEWGYLLGREREALDDLKRIAVEDPSRSE